MSARSHDCLRLLTLACFTVALAVAAFSHLQGTIFGRIGPTHSLFVRSEFGKFILHLHLTDTGDAPRWLAATWPHGAEVLSPGVGGWWRYGGFGYAVGGTAGGNTVRQVAVPYWPLMALMLLMWMLLLPMRGTAIRAAPIAASNGQSPYTPRQPTR